MELCLQTEGDRAMGPEKGFYVRRRLRSPEREEEDGVRRCAGTASQAASFAVAEGH